MSIIIRFEHVMQAIVATIPVGYDYNHILNKKQIILVCTMYIVRVFRVFVLYSAYIIIFISYLNCAC